MLKVGQGLLGRICYANGEMPPYNRPYLIVEMDAHQVGVLNVSSVAGKEHKLLFRSNYRMAQYDPPFLKDSFVKLDSLVYLSHDIAAQMRVLHGGECLDTSEMGNILRALEEYQ